MSDDDHSFQFDQLKARLETVETTLDSLENSIEALDRILTDVQESWPDTEE